MGVSRNNLEDYLLFIEKAGMIAQLRNGSASLNAFGKTEKVFLDNSNLIFALSDGSPESGTVRETFFFNQMRVNNDVIASTTSDFKIKGMTFEIGGKNKGSEQIKDAMSGYIAKDNIEYGYGNIIPLWAFGLNY